MPCFCCLLLLLPSKDGWLSSFFILESIIHCGCCSHLHAISCNAMPLMLAVTVVIADNLIVSFYHVCKHCWLCSCSCSLFWASPAMPCFCCLLLFLPLMMVDCCLFLFLKASFFSVVVAVSSHLLQCHAFAVCCFCSCHRWWLIVHVVGINGFAVVVVVCFNAVTIAIANRWLLLLFSLLLKSMALQLLSLLLTILHCHAYAFCHHCFPMSIQWSRINSQIKERRQRKTLSALSKTAMLVPLHGSKK